MNKPFFTRRSLPMATYAGIAAVVLIGALLALIVSRPNEYRVERTAVIDAPPEVVFPLINNLQNFGLWSPYDKRDPNMQRTFSGPAAGPGAAYAWNGNNDVGEGRLTIMKSVLNELVEMKLEFVRPFKCTNQVHFPLERVDGGTRVSWIMDARNNFMSKAMSLVMNMDKMIGDDFAQGLVNLNHVAREEAGKAHPVASR
jgi:hypothetical protein